MDDQIVNMPTRSPVTLRVERAAKVIGMPTYASAVRGRAFKRLGFAFVEGEGKLTVTAANAPL